MGLSRVQLSSRSRKRAILVHLRTWGDISPVSRSQGRSPEVPLEWTAKSSLQRGKGRRPLAGHRQGFWESPLFWADGGPHTVPWVSRTLRAKGSHFASRFSRLSPPLPQTGSQADSIRGRSSLRALRGARTRHVCPLSLKPPHPMSSDRPHFTEGKTQIQKGQARGKGAWP